MNAFVLAYAFWVGSLDGLQIPPGATYGTYYGGNSLILQCDRDYTVRTQHGRIWGVPTGVYWAVYQTPRRVYPWALYVNVEDGLRIQPAGPLP